MSPTLLLERAPIADRSDPCSELGADAELIGLRTATLPKVLWIELTSRCPFDCVFCSRKLLRGNGKHMDFELYRRLIAELHEPEIIRLNYSGESVHYPHLVEAVELAAATGATVELVTALAALPEAKIDALARSGLSLLTVSLHTMDPQQFRQIYRFGELSQLRKRLERIVELAPQAPRPLRVDLAFVAMQRNLQQLPAVVQYAAELGLSRVAVHPVIRRDPIEERFEGELDGDRLRPQFAAEIELQVAELQQRFPNVAIESSTPEVVGQCSPTPTIDATPRPYPGPMPVGSRIHSCDQDPWHTVHILADGSVVSCEERDRIALGSLREHSLQQIWHSSAYVAFRHSYVLGSDERCRRCPYKQLHRLQAPPQRILPGRHGDSGLLSGWHAENGATLAWSKRRALLQLRGRRGQQLRLKLLLPPGLGEPNRVHLSVAGERIDSAENYGTEHLAVQLHVPVGADGVLRLELQVEQGFKPSERGLSNDLRDLGVGLIEAVSVTSQSRSASWWLLNATLWLAERSAWLWREPAARAVRPAPWRPGLSVLIPDRCSPALLALCLPALRRALQRIDEPWEIVISSSAASADDYAGVAADHPQVRWLYHRQALGYARAIDLGLRAVRYEHVYLLNNDMIIDSQALVEVLARRADKVFAVASQIEFADRNRRREETGLTAAWGFGRRTTIYDLDPGTATAPLPHLYAGGGASLFRTAPLRRLVQQARVYEPVYWEDVEWGVRAWAEGWQVLFCPSSLAVHQHRATVNRVFSSDEVERIIARNALQFDLRNIAATPRSALLKRFAALPPRSRRELLRPSNLWSMLRRRANSQFERPPRQWFFSQARIDIQLGQVSSPAPQSVEERATLLCVTPFALLPTTHGGARRTLELLRQLSADYRIVLLSDEGNLYPPQATTQLPWLDALLSVRDRPPAVAGESREQRGLRHARAELREGLSRARALYRPQRVLICHDELIALIDQRENTEHWTLDLHDVQAELPAHSYQSYDAVLAASTEDLALLQHRNAHLVGNACSLNASHYLPSAEDTETVLFVGNLRYPPNRIGLQTFLKLAWPTISTARPSAQLWLAGIDLGEAKLLFGLLPESVVALGPQQDLAALYQACSLTINPLQQIRGSALKVAESLSAGRVCVSTESGARGFLELSAPGLLSCAEIAQMSDLIIDLLADCTARRRLERPPPAIAEQLSWEFQGRQLLSVLAATERASK